MKFIEATEKLEKGLAVTRPDWQETENGPNFEFYIFKRCIIIDDDENIRFYSVIMNHEFDLIPKGLCEEEFYLSIDDIRAEDWNILGEG